MAGRKGTIAIVLPNLAGGGVERVRLLLAEQFLAAGHGVDFVLMSRSGELLGEVPDGCRIVSLDAPRFLSGIPRLWRYVATERPEAILGAMWPMSAMAATVARLARFRGRVVVSEHSDLRNSPWIPPLQRLALRRFGRWLYGRADAIVAVSSGARDGVIAEASVPPEKVHVIHNPIRAPSGAEAESRDAELLHWWAEGELKLIAVGALKLEKDYPTLLRALRHMRDRKDVRLLVLGEGPDRAALEDQAHRDGVADHVRFAGFRSDPFPYLARADLFVLSSDREGLGNVILEALACGLPVVSTDCRSGPRELLGDGRYGTLVPVGDSERLAEAVIAAASARHEPAPGRAWAARFSAGAAATAYFDLLFGKGERMEGRT